MEPMKQAHRSLSYTLWALYCASAIQVASAADATTAVAVTCADTQKDPCKWGPAILIKCSTTPVGLDVKKYYVTGGSFACYLTSALQKNMPYAILLAVILVVVSGLQYMTSMGAPAAQGAAKTRIIGILTGIIFYTILSYILPVIVGGISL
jgi:triacylglycerol esterase/lipase EstA (alpha/beta hydrolase family)